MDKESFIALAEAVDFLLGVRHRELEQEDATLAGKELGERKRIHELEAQLDELDRYRDALRATRNRLTKSA
jgi:hypothetical protein